MFAGESASSSDLSPAGSGCLPCAMMPGECIILGKLVHGIFPALEPSIGRGFPGAVFYYRQPGGHPFCHGIVQFLLTVALFRRYHHFHHRGVPELEAQNFKPLFRTRRRRHTAYDPDCHAGIHGIRCAPTGC